MLPLGFIIFPLLINLLNEQKNNDSILSFFIYGFIYGIGFLTIFLSWIYNPFLIYDDVRKRHTMSVMNGTLTVKTNILK